MATGWDYGREEDAIEFVRRSVKRSPEPGPTSSLSYVVTGIARTVQPIDGVPTFTILFVRAFDRSRADQVVPILALDTELDALSRRVLRNVDDRLCPGASVRIDVELCDMSGRIVQARFPEGMELYDDDVLDLGS